MVQPVLDSTEQRDSPEDPLKLTTMYWIEMKFS